MQGAVCLRRTFGRKRTTHHRRQPIQPSSSIRTEYAEREKKAWESVWDPQKHSQIRSFYLRKSWPSFTYSLPSSAYPVTLPIIAHPVYNYTVFLHIAQSASISTSNLSIQIRVQEIIMRVGNTERRAQKRLSRRSFAGITVKASATLSQSMVSVCVLT